MLFRSNASILRDALREVTGRALPLVFAMGSEAAPAAGSANEPHELTEDDIISLIKDELDAREVEDPQ